jgi:hypothetical protein
MMDFVTWDGWKFPTEWKVIKFHGSKPPTRILSHALILDDLGYHLFRKHPYYNGDHGEFTG